MKVKVSDLEGRALNYAVAFVQWGNPRLVNKWMCFRTGDPYQGWPLVRLQPKEIQRDEYNPSGNWAHGGLEIEKHSLQLNVGPYGCDAAYYNPDLDQFEGPDFEHRKPLVAAMRCIVFALHQKDEIEIPDELVQS